MSTGWMLLDKQNPNASVRDDGLRYWGHPTRQGETVTRAVVHTAEIESDLDPPDLTAERVGSYFTITDVPSSYHRCTDLDSAAKLLPPDHVAFGARGHNRVGWQISFATRARSWPEMSGRTIERYLDVAAPVLAEALDLFDLPTRRLSDSDARDTTKRGIVGHYQTDPTRRSDPGAGFPWDAFLRKVDQHRSTAMTGPQHPHPDPKVAEFDSWAADIARLVRLKVMTSHTATVPADLVTVGQLADYLTNWLDSTLVETRADKALIAEVDELAADLTVLKSRVGALEASTAPVVDVEEIARRVVELLRVETSVEVTSTLVVADE